MSMQAVTVELDGKTYSLETGRMAKFANGAVMARCEDTMVLVTVTCSDEEIEQDFMPLQVEYREKTASSGKFPGGFLKREGRPSDKEVLASRLIDRPLRPLFPDKWRYDTQVLPTVYSFDQTADPESLAAVGASAALMLSDMPFDGPISEVRIGRIDGMLIMNPSIEEMEQSELEFLIAGSDTSIVMVEGECKEISEQEFLEALEFAHERIKELNNLQRRLVELVQVEKREVTETQHPEDLIDLVKNEVTSKIEEVIHKDTDKKERSALRKEIKEALKEKVAEVYGEREDYEEFPYEDTAAEIFEDIEKDMVRKMILDESRRLDGRGLTDIREITCEVGILTRTHGSALFTRGETQSLATTTLGTRRDEQMIDGLLPVYTENFILHYNFPPFSTGEVKRLFTGRREIGHGNLAWRALKEMIPDDENFPYTIRVVSDILESNGSSSMATVCAGCLSLLDAGVPIHKHVAGIAMGLIKEDDRIAVLSDILGDEDHLGDMDFKVTGTVDGITACQMDIKIEGLSIDIMKQALEQARQGRLHIIEKMKETITESRPDVSRYAPRFETMKVPTDMIGTVIGPGGETIREISRETDTDIEIQDDGTVMIAATAKENSDKAKEWIESLTEQPEEGKVYRATVKDIREGLGAIVEFLPKKTGLLHISQLAYEHVKNVSDVLEVGQELDLELIEVSRDGKFRLSRKRLLPKPEGYDDSRDNDRSRKRPPKGGGRDRDRGGSRDRRR